MFLGNVFVIAAIILERNLQNVANYLVASLAVADLLVACLVMPLGAVYEVIIMIFFKYILIETHIVGYSDYWLLYSGDYWYSVFEALKKGSNRVGWCYADLTKNFQHKNIFSIQIHR